MKLLFCNVGWMKYYDGVRDDDVPERGGAYNNDNIGHEVCNFTNANGMVFGYVQPTGENRIETLGAKPGDSYIDGVTVVWLAGPKGGGTAVVGWYKNATVYRHEQKQIPPTQTHKKCGVDGYRIKAKYDDAVLLPEQSRNLLIPRAIKGGIGQSNVWYAQAPESQIYVDRVLELINQGCVVPELDEEVTGVEGTPRLRAHLVRERDRRVVIEKKKQAIQNGSLQCEICNFDFLRIYGELGREFCEVHHLIPLHKADGFVETRLDDLALVCSNCHRMIHRSSPMMDIDQMRSLIESVATDRV